MDKLAKYKNLIRNQLASYTDLVNQHPDKSIQAHPIFDDEHGRYMVFKTGWWDANRIRTPTLYLHLDDGKIWIEEDWTEDGVATELLKAGVPKEDIVLAFHHPSMRSLTDFAVA